jgi:RNA-binding protein
LSSRPSKFPIAYIEIRVFSHATEDIENVQTATRNILPETLATGIAFSNTNLNGHHGNPITIIEAKLEDRKLLPSALEKIGANLSPLDKTALNEELKTHLEKSSLFLRFDKQSAYMGTTKLASNDPIHFKVHFKNKTPEEIEDICRKAGILP